MLTDRFISLYHVGYGMAKGYPVSKSVNLGATIAESKRVLLETKDWERTKEHLNYWIRSKWGFSRMTVNDYIENAAARLMSDTETRGLLK